MRRLTLVLAVLATACAGLLAPAGATAAKRKKSKNPTVTSVSPMRIKAGRTLSIRGRNFSRNRRRNTVIFAVGRRSIFAKPRRSSSRRLVVTVPVSLERLMRVRDNALSPTRFSLKVATNRRFSRKTSRRLSPVVVPLNSAKITVPGAPGSSGGGGSTGGSDTPSQPSAPADCDGDGTPNSSDAVSDPDLLSDVQERALGTDPCDADTDNDGAEDGFEYRSALDLNHFPRTPPYPYPGRRPYPNPLDPTDGGIDYDGDSLTVREEFLAWFRYSSDGVRRDGRPTGAITSPATPMLYSDGLQKSIDPAPLAPVGDLYNWAIDQNDDNRLWDDERDVDNDGISNFSEQHGQFTEAWWAAQYDGTNGAKESKYPDIDFLDVEDLPGKDALTDPDLDGDQVVDGSDDHDHDGLTNQYELRRPDNWVEQAIDDGAGHALPNANNPYAYVNPFNPCKPFNSERCHQHPPFGYYSSDQMPPIGPNPPPNYTTAHPGTPNG